MPLPTPTATTTIAGLAAAAVVVVCVQVWTTPATQASDPEGVPLCTSSLVEETPTYEMDARILATMPEARPLATISRHLQEASATAGTPTLIRCWSLGKVEYETSVRSVAVDMEVDLFDKSADQAVRKSAIDGLRKVASSLEGSGYADARVERMPEATAAGD